MLYKIGSSLSTSKLMRTTTRFGFQHRWPVKFAELYCSCNSSIVHNCCDAFEAIRKVYDEYRAQGISPCEIAAIGVRETLIPVRCSRTICFKPRLALLRMWPKRRSMWQGCKFPSCMTRYRKAKAVCSAVTVFASKIQVARPEVKATACNIPENEAKAVLLKLNVQLLADEAGRVTHLQNVLT